jgi:hypothetical protein
MASRTEPIGDRFFGISRAIAPAARFFNIGVLGAWLAFGAQEKHYHRQAAEVATSVALSVSIDGCRHHQKQTQAEPQLNPLIIHHTLGRS